MRKSRVSPKKWTLQDAKNKLSQVVEAAARGQPQIVTRRGVETAVIISHQEYQRLSGALAKSRPSLAKYLLDMPTSRSNGAFARIRLRPRGLDD